MVGTSNLGSWHGHWCIQQPSKSSTSSFCSDLFVQYSQSKVSSSSSVSPAALAAFVSIEQLWDWTEAPTFCPRSVFSRVTIPLLLTIGALALRMTIDGDREDYADARQSDQQRFRQGILWSRPSSSKLHKSDFMTCHNGGLLIVLGRTECKQSSISAGQVFDAPQSKVSKFG